MAVYRPTTKDTRASTIKIGTTAMITTRIAPRITAEPVMIDARYVQLMSVEVVCAATAPANKPTINRVCISFLSRASINMI